MRLFEKDDARSYELLLILLEERENTDVTIAFLSKKMNTDRRIIQKCLHRLIEDSIHTKSPDKLNLHIDTQGTIRLTVPPSFDKNAFKAMYYERSISFKLMIDILMGQFVSIEDFAERNFISIPSVYRKFPYLKEQLQTLQIDLDLKKEKRFSGSERQVRLFYFYLLNDVQNYLDIPDFLTADEQKRYDSFANLWLTITYFRITSQNYIHQLDELDRVETFPQKEEQFYQLWHDSLGTFFQSFSLEDDVLAYERHSLYVVFNSTMGLFSNRQSLSTIATPDKIEQLETSIEKVSFMWTERFIDFFNVPVEKADFNYIYQVMLNGHVISYIFNRQVQWIHRMDYYNLVILENKELDRKIEDFFELLKNDPHFQDFSKTGFTYTLSLGYTFFVHSFLTLMNPPVKIYIFSKLGYLATTYIQDKVTKFSMVPVSLVSSEADADLLITDTYNPFNIDISVLYVQPIPREDELTHIKSIVEKTYYEKMLN